MKVLKKRFMCLMLVCAMIAGVIPFASEKNVLTVEASTKSTNKKAVAAYKKMLSKSKLSWTYGNRCPAKYVKFYVKDINRDGIRELLLQYDHASHAEGMNRVYTYSGGRVKSLGIFNVISYYSNRKFFRDYYAGCGTQIYDYYKLTKDGKKLVKAASYSVSDSFYGVTGPYVKKLSPYGFYEYYHSFRVYGKSTGYGRCAAVIRNLKRGAKKDKIHYHKNTASNRKKYLK